MRDVGADLPHAFDHRRKPFESAVNVLRETVDIVAILD